MKNFILVLLLGTVLFSCKKDCLEKDKCELSTYTSSYLIEAPAPETGGQKYYVDNENGKNKNDGTSPDQAFKEIEQVNGLALNPGDQVLFHRGQIHYGVLRVEHSGTIEANIYFSDYGAGHLPVIKSSDGSGSSNESTVYATAADHITFQNLNIQGGLFAVSLSNSDYVTIDGCRIGERSNAGILATGKYSDGNGSDFGVLRNSLIYSGQSGNVGDGQSTDGINLNDGASNWLIHHNEFKAWAHSAVSIKQIANLKSNNNNVIEGNYFDCGDIDYMRALDISGGDHLCENNIFQRNIVRNQSVTSHVHGNSNTVAYNLILGLTVSSATEQPWAFDFYCIINKSGNPGRDQLVCYDNKIINNLVYNYTTGQGVRALKSKSQAAYEVHDNLIANNIFYNVQTAFQTDIEVNSTTFSNNLIYNSGSGIEFIYNGSSYHTIETFEALTGSEGNQFLDNLSSDPLFTNPSGENFSLQPGSPAIDAGLDVEQTMDYNLNPIIGNPDIGPFEF